MPETLRFIRPCSPVRAVKPPAGATWLHELKLDGYRLQIVKDRREVRAFTRRGAEWTERLAAFADAFVGLACRSAIQPLTPGILTDPSRREGAFNRRATIALR